MTARLPRAAKLRFSVVGAIVVLALCVSSASVSGTSVSTTRNADVVDRCTAGRTLATLVQFMRAFNAGDFRRLNGLFAGPTLFRWYSSSAPGVRFDPMAQQRSTLIGYFRERHRQHDRLRLVSFQFNGNFNGSGNFIWKMRRAAADFRDGAWFSVQAKGAVLCRTASVRFIVISIGAAEA
jgi:hypothetical protein